MQKVLLSLPDHLADRMKAVIPPGQRSKVLADLLEIYLEGMRRPFPFSPEVSWEYASAAAAGRPDEEALSRAKNKWEGGPGFRGLSEDPYYELCFRETGLVESPRFKAAALEIFGPLISSLEVVE